MSGVAVMHDDEGHLFPKSSQLGQRLDGWIEEGTSPVAQLHTTPSPRSPVLQHLRAARQKCK